MISKEIWQQLANYFRSKLVAKIDVGQLFVHNSMLQQSLEIPHKGFYVGVIDSVGNQIIREGFLSENLTNVMNSADIVLENIYGNLINNGVTVSKLQTSTFYFYIINDVVYLANPMAWDDKQDGVYFQWGQNYKSMFLPYQVKLMNMPKTDILDRLCASSGTVSNLWKLPEGLIFALKNESHST
jgi:hypothetical protein